MGISPDQVLDFSVNSNPYGPSLTVWRTLQQTPLDRYPDREAWALRRALAALLSVDLQEIVVGNGTAELIWLVALAFVQRDDRVLILGPTFGEYAHAAALMGAKIHELRTQPEQRFQFDTAEIHRTLQRDPYRMVFICNPNNPTGQVIPREHIALCAQGHPQTLFVVDEAYLAFVPRMKSTIALSSENILVLRSMTKDYALAGLRLGYAVGRAPIIQAIVAVRPPWNVNALAQAAGIAAIEDQAHLQSCLQKIAAAKKRLFTGIIEAGFTAIPSNTHFFLVNVGDGAAFRGALLRQGIQVRDCASFGLPEYVRIATRRSDENQRLLAAMQKLGPRKSSWKTRDKS